MSLDARERFLLAVLAAEEIVVVLEEPDAGDGLEVHWPTGCDTPISGLIAQRLVPTLMSLSAWYSPLGAETVRLTPSVVVGLAASRTPPVDARARR